MQMLRRVGVFLLTNLAVMITLSLAMAVLGHLGLIPPGEGGRLVAFGVVWGFGGAFISLLLSKTMAKWTTGAHVIEQPRDQHEQWLLSTVARLAQDAGIGMPEVAIYDAPEMNAFATGATRNSSLVAVSTGLMRQMNPAEVEAVLAHEISHVANGDMVTMTLVQGVLNACVYIFSRLLAKVVVGFLSRGDRDRGPSAIYYGLTFVFDLILGAIATMIAMWFSRRREFRADAGAAQLRGPGSMIAALQALSRNHPPALPAQLKAMGISGSVRSLFSSHPPLEERIAALHASR